METRANYVLIGACTLAAIVLGLGFFVWLAKFQIDRQYAYYDVLLRQRLGPEPRRRRALQRPVGRPGACRSTSAGTRPGRSASASRSRPTRRSHEGATAQLQAQGVTGVSVVALTAGDTSKPLLRDTTGGSSGHPGAAVGGADTDRGCTRPSPGGDKAGQGLAGRGRTGEPATGLGDPRQCRAGLRRVRRQR